MNIAVTGNISIMFRPIWGIMKEFNIIQVKVSQFYMSENNIYVNTEFNIKECNVKLQDIDY
jgi:hypothetical protein